MKHNTWHYAKRQMTWFRRDKNIKWISNRKKRKKSWKNFLDDLSFRARERNLLQS